MWLMNGDSDGAGFSSPVTVSPLGNGRFGGTGRLKITGGLTAAERAAAAAAASAAFSVAGKTSAAGRSVTEPADTVVPSYRVSTSAPLAALRGTSSSIALSFHDATTSGVPRRVAEPAVPKPDPMTYMAAPADGCRGRMEPTTACTWMGCGVSSEMMFMLELEMGYRVSSCVSRVSAASPAQ